MIISTIMPDDDSPFTPVYFSVRQESPSSTSDVAASPTPSPNDQNQSNNGPENKLDRLPKSVLEYIFLAVVVFIVLCIFCRKCRFCRLQRQYNMNNGVRDAFRRGRRMEPTNSNGQTYPPFPDPNLTGFPAAYISTRNRRTQATDIDSGGRRLGELPAEIDHDGELGGKDVLPAYDNFGGPPKYYEVEMESRSRPPLSSGTVQRVLDGDSSDNTSSANDNSRTIAASSHTSTN